ncbi:hypothetical protein BDV36DRAFT_282629 [Aspergillus pseudocaelatus]|uniref:Peptidase M3A/M3B catalytic domain-containing protein n=1 Tax=Aspergillus pseudocaelatus TaxID=1825620 RepID=A0ABQ6WP37_9EURO|nr:hypothetical protein BDV36DRAFT_282629 [Aspergillus pseudocaelatus]
MVTIKAHDTAVKMKIKLPGAGDIERDVQPNTATFSNVILPLSHIDNNPSSKSHIFVFYRAVSTNPELLNASTEARNLLDSYNVETRMDGGLFALVYAVFHKSEDLDVESHRLLKKMYTGFVRRGLRLSSGCQRYRFREIQSRLSWIKAEFQRNLVEANSTGIWFTVEKLDGLPDEFLSTLMRGEAEGDNEDKIRVTFSDSDLFQTLRYARDSETRRRIYIANENKCGQSRLLWYPSHAALRIEDKMAKFPETVNSFLGDLQSQLGENCGREVEKLKQLKKADFEFRGETFDGRYFLWDHQYYHRMMLEKQYSVHQQKIVEYFPLLGTIMGMLEICETLFGLSFSKFSTDQRTKLANPGDALVWHGDVQVFSVWNSDEGDGFVGYLYLDLFLREGKYANAANFNLIPGLTQENGTRLYPVTAVVCNFSKPSSKTPSTEVDFGETPSQMLENWCWTPSVLQSLSRRYSYLSLEYYDYWKERADGEPQPHEQIPDAMISRLLRTKHVNIALFHLCQLHFAMFDMVVHDPGNHHAIEELDISAKYTNLLAEILPMDGPEDDDWGHGQTRFQHLLGEYDAGYYSYLFSKVYSTDMFYTVFKAGPTSYLEGWRYRYTVLTDSSGREPQTDAFYKELCQA